MEENKQPTEQQQAEPEQTTKTEENPIKKETNKVKKDLLLAGIGVGVLLAVLLFGAYTWTNNDDTEQNDTTNEESSEVVATVGDIEIYQHEIDAQLAQQQLPQGSDPQMIEQLEDQILTNIINTEVLYQHASTQIEVTEEDIQTEIAKIKENFEDDAAYQAELEKNDITEEELLTNIEKQLTINKFIEQYRAENPVEVSEEEVQEQYDLYAEQQGEEAPAFEEIEEQLRNQLEQQKMQQKLIAFVEQLKEEIEVTINE